MPRINEQTDHDREVELALARIEEFENAAAWKRSARGNLWREWEGATITVFAKKGMFGWCIADEEEKRFSKEEYNTQEDAVMGLADALWVSGV